MSLRTGVGDEEWMAAWTIFYWAWWISWAPFVGMFVARISRGRTIREFVLGVVAAPTGFGFLWFAVVGGTGIELQRTGQADLLARSPRRSCRCSRRWTPCRCQHHLGGLHLPDRAVLRQRCGRGGDRDGDDGRPGSLEPPRFVVLVLGVLMGGIACAMLLVGGLSALQQAAVLGAVPFTFVIVGVAWCWIKALREETVPPTGRRPSAPDVPQAARAETPPAVRQALRRGEARESADARRRSGGGARADWPGPRRLR